MTIAEIIAAIAAAEQLIPALVSFFNTIHPPTTSAPTKAVAVLTATNVALAASGTAAQTIQALAPTLTAASNAALGIAVAPAATQAGGQQ